MEPIQGNVSIDAQNIMPIIKKWLYSDKDIFIREVVSNGCDAITKLRMVDSAAAQNCSIHVEVDKAARELRFIDDGIGMAPEQVAALLQNEPSDRTGIGIKNVNDRLRIYFGPGYGLSIDSVPDEGTTVTIRMPQVPADREGDYDKTR